jgi:diaminopimelate decarboxylase
MAFDDLVDRFGSPLHVVDAVALASAARRAVSPGVARAASIFSSYKTNPVPGILQILHGEGVGAEVISAYELWLAMRLGVPGERLIYNGPAKSPASLRTAVEHGALAINANSTAELADLGDAAGAAGRRANIGLRVTLPGMWGGQFGIPSTSPRLLDAIEAARRDDRLALVALHAHRGGRLRTAAEFTAHVEQVVAFSVALRDQTGWVPSILDLGGSLATPTVGDIGRRDYRLNRALATDLLPPDPASCLALGQATIIAQEMVDAALGRDGDVRAVLEPGRALTGSSQLLLTTVLNIHLDGSLPHAILDAGINLAEPTHGEYHQVFHTRLPTAPGETSYRLVGPICMPSDVLYHHWRLPDLTPGDVLAVMDTGAYFVPFSTSFSFPRPAIVVQHESDCTVIRRAESFEDLVRLDEP